MPAGGTGASDLPANPARGGPAAPRAADRRPGRDSLSRARSARPTPGARSAARNGDAPGRDGGRRILFPSGGRRRNCGATPYENPAVVCGCVAVQWAGGVRARRRGARRAAEYSLRARGPVAHAGVRVCRRSQRADAGNRPTRGRERAVHERGRGHAGVFADAGVAAHGAEAAHARDFSQRRAAEPGGGDAAKGAEGGGLRHGGDRQVAHRRARALQFYPARAAAGL